MSIVIRPETLRHVCKEPLANVQSVQLRGRGITRLVGLTACPNLTSLDISYNALTELESVCFEGCKELWIVDASHNRLESLKGLSSLMALGYLNLSCNPLPLEGLRPLAHAHILELFLGKVRSGQERRRALGLLPNVWVLDNEYVTARERRTAEDAYSHVSGERHDHLLQTWNKSALPHSRDKKWDRDGAGDEHIDSRNEGRTGHQRPVPKNALGGRFGFGSLETQGRQAREFYENILWKLPSRTDAADTFRLATLLESYDKRTAAANTSAWLGTFTCGGVGGGVRGCVRRDWSFASPRPHLDALMSLSLELKLDVAVLLAARAILWNNFPQQVLEEAFMVLLVLQGGLSGSIHTDLSRVPAFICTALVHALRSSILRLLDQNSMAGRADTTAPPLLDRQQTDLLEALPPVVTGVDVDDVFEHWRRSTFRTKDPTRRGDGGHSPAGVPGKNDQDGGNSTVDPLDGDRDVLARANLRSEHTTAAVEAVVETRLPTVTADLDGDSSNENVPTCSSAEEKEICSDGGVEMPAATGLPKADEGAADVVADAVVDAGDTTQDYPEAYAPPSGVGLTRLCRRAVILLTRSPACPDLVAWQTHPAEQRTYDQMEPLLARAKMAHKDLHPRLTMGDGVGGDGRKAALARSALKTPSTPSLEFDPSRTAGETGERREDATYHQPRDAFQSPADGFWPAKLRRPKAGERVQVLQDTWSVIVTIHPETFSVLAAPFEGMQLPPYHGDSCLDSRDLCYDPRGWWRHAPALITTPPTGTGRLHRLARGISATGLPWGAGSLNEPVVEPKADERRPLRGGRETAHGWPSHDCTGPLLNQETTARENRAPASASRPPTVAASAARRAPSNPPLAQAVPRQDGHPGKHVVGVFSAEGSWDPVFVVAPPRLVGLQNQSAARKRGRRTARQVAWRRIDRPEASLAPRPMMPRCSSLPAAPTEESDTRPRFLKRASIFGLPDDRPCPRLVMVAPSHGGSSGYLWSADSRSLLVPSINTLGGHSAADQKTALSGDDAWLELQREMGSLKAHNRMLLRGNRGGGGGGQGTGAHASRGASGSVASVLTKSLEEISTVCGEATTGLLAKTLSFGLDSPKPAWKGGKSEDKPTTVFELTQVDGEPETSSAESSSATAVATNVSCPHGGGKQTGETHPRSTGGSARGAEGRGRGTSNQPQEADPATATATTSTRTWKPNAHRPLEWFPVRGRQVLLVDPNDVNATAAGAAEETAAGGMAGRSAEPNPSGRVELRPREKKGEGGDRGGGSSSSSSSTNRETKGGGREHHRERRRRPRDKVADDVEEGQQQVGGAKPKTPGGGQEQTIQQIDGRSEIVLSARSIPSAAPLAGLSRPPTPTDTKPGAMGTAAARSLSGRCRARPRTSASRTWGRHEADAPSGRALARNSSTAMNLAASHSQPKARGGFIGGIRRAPEASRREKPCAPMSALGGGVCIGQLLVTPEDTRKMPFTPNERQGEQAGGGTRGRVEKVGISSPRREGSARSAVSASLMTERGGLQIQPIQRLPVETTATVSRASPIARKEPALAAAPGQPSERRHPPPGASHSQLQRAAISRWEGEGANVVRPQEERSRMTGSGMDRARGRGGAKMLPTMPGAHSDNSLLGDTFSAGSVNSSISGWNRVGNSQP